MADNGSIESLTLEVTAKSASAEQAVDKLISTLERLSTKTANLGLGNIGTQLNGVRRAAAGFGDKEAAGIERIFNALSKLQGIANLKISSSIANQLTNIGVSAELIQNVDFSGVQRLSTALSGLAGVGQVNISSALNQLNRIPKIAESLNSVDMTAFSAKIKEVTESLKPLADEMEKVSKGFSAFPDKLKKVLRETEKVPSANNRAAKSYAALAAKIAVAVAAAKRIAGVFANMTKESIDFVESQNLFNVAMGQYSTEARNYAELVSDKMGINPAEWMKGQGVLMTLGTGFGIAGDKAAEMSKNMTQLAYDLSSFYNISTEEAFQKLESGFAGEIEPMRRLGYDLSNAALQQIAYSKGINKTVSSMSQAEKASLRYYAMMTQVTQVQGDMARTINSPANQLRILRARVQEASRAIGNLLIPIMQKVVPWLIAGAEAVTRFAEGLALIFGIKNTDETGDMIESIVGGSENIEDALGGAAEQATKLKKTLLGIDELNVLNEKETGINLGDTGSGTGILDGLFGDEGGSLPGYDFLEQLQEQADELIAGLDIDGLRDKILTFANLVSDLAMITGSFKLGGIGKIVTGFGEIYDAFKNFQTEGINFDNVLEFIGGLANVLGGISLLFGEFKIAGMLTALHGLTDIVKIVIENWEEIKRGDFSSLGSVDGIIAIVELIGGLAIAFGVFDRIKGMFNAKKNIETASTGMGKTFGALKTLAVNLGLGLIILAEVAAAAALIVGAIGLLGWGLQKVAEAWEPVIENSETVITAIGAGIGLMTVIGVVCYALGSVGKVAATNIGIGMAILAEIGIATALFVAEIWILGEGLSKVAESWTPVLENSETVITAIGIGTGLLVGIGVACAILGTLGATVAVNIGIGMAILIEIGIAAGLFIAEIWLIGEGLAKIADAWEPVLNNGDDIATAILIGTGLLVGIGLAAAGLGAVTVASYGTIPVAIAIGTALLVELGIAFDLFVDSLVTVADSLSLKLAPALDRVNGVLPSLTTNMSNFVDFMVDFAEEVVRYTEASAVSGLASTIDTIIGWFAGDPIDNLVSEIEDVGEHAGKLIDKLVVVNPELDTAVQMLTDFRTLVSTLNDLLGIDITLSDGMYVNMNEVGMNLVAGLAQGMMTMQPLLMATLLSITQSIVIGFILPVQEQFMLFFESLNMSFTMNAILINETYAGSAATISAVFIAALTAQFAAFFVFQTTQFSMLRVTITTTFQQSYVAAVSGFMTPTRTQAANMVTQLKSLFISLKASIVSSFNQAAAGARSAFSGLASWFRSAVYSPIVSMLSSLRSQISSVIASANSAASHVASLSVGRYASGGLPSTGEVFVARERGPELVGRIGNQSAVANNNQIIDGIRQGVYEAMMASNSGSRSGDINLYVGGKQLMTAVAEEARRETLRTGINPLTQGG